jgi:hypothetical protein
MSNIEALDMHWNINDKKIVANGITSPGNDFPIEAKEAAYGVSADDVVYVPVASNSDTSQSATAQLHKISSSACCTSAARPPCAFIWSSHAKRITVISGVKSKEQSRILQSSDHTNLRHIQSLAISVPPKIWRPKPAGAWRELDYSDDMDDKLFLFRECGKSLKCPDMSNDPPPRDEIAEWDEGVVW